VKNKGERRGTLKKKKNSLFRLAWGGQKMATWPKRLEEKDTASSVCPGKRGQGLDIRERPYAPSE